ncbi:unnamed protein product [Zymoseptoria tritici ST99CH_1A5]|uniref:Uncharacterized protein n=1 Tax=Zymoseptoria tritici ST99CH_1A5 TaxID=1276529 RepID=A0A1Y6LPJ2_ZYMTR|nr:unnamed protein product [Zymoseptoria tritici ST99CH_1A5]
MAATDREGSRDRHHQHSRSESSTSSRAGVPMWDSGIPDRAPPPLPLNTTNGSPATKPNTSAGIAAAAKQIVERARESTPLSTYTSNASGSPERSLIKGGVQKRMQSLQKLQTGNVKDLRNYLDNNNNRSPERAPDRPTSRGAYLPYNRMSSIEDDPFDPPSPTLPERDPSKDTPTPRPSSRQPCKAILGENTPPSATMLALQNMQLPEMPPSLADMTNRPSTPGGTRVPTQYDFSSQLLNITTIATNLQKEMAQLSRRSKDNATDLLALKSATHSRDEDIRKTLKELAGSVTSSIPQQLLGPPPLGTPRSQSFGNFYPDGNMFSSPPSASKRHSMPRAQSAHSFADDARCGSPSPYSVEGAASVAMLEKIIREMVTKEGQERLQSTLAELLEKSRRDNVDAAKKVEELSEFIKLKSQSQALVHMPNGDGPPQLDLNFDTPRKDSKKESNSAAQDEVLRLLQRIKDSISHSGGTTSEVKGLVRDLRGEVLGMGRELGKKLDQIGESHANTTADRSANENREMEHLEEIQRVVEEGLSELKQHMTMALKQRAEQDDDAFKQLSTTRAGADGDEVLAVVKHALAEHSSMFSKPTAEADVPTLDKEGVLDAVKEGLKDFEPNIELQQFGLERDEILAVLQEGLEEYRNTRAEPPVANIDKGEIFEVMQEALKDFQAPYPEAQLSELKDELLGTIRQTLEDFKPPPVDAAVNQEVLHAAVFDAIKLGMENHGPSAPRELEISRNDLFDAVKASLDGSAIPFGGIGEQVISQMQELIDGMRGEFKQYSAANGRDTEQVLDAVNDGLERLRVDVESYVDKAQDVTGKDEIVDSVKMGLEQLRQDVQGYCAQGPVNDTGKSEMLDYIKSEFEHLHTTMANRETSRDLDASDVVQNAAVIVALKEGLDGLKSHLETRDEGSSQSSEDLNEAMKEEFEQLKGAILNANSADKNELIETIQDSLGALHAKFNGSDVSGLSSGGFDEIHHTLREELSTLKESLHAIVSEVEKDAIVSDIRQNLDDLRTQLSGDQSDHAAETLGAIKEELQSFRDSFGSALVVGGGSSEHAGTLHALKATVDEIKESTAKSSSGALTDEQLEAIRGEFENLRTSIASSVVHSGSNEEVLDALRLGLDDLRSHLEKKLDNPESVVSHQGQVLDALNEHLESLRTDVIKTLDKPLDMTVNYEILDTLKDGLTELRAEMSKLTSGSGASQGGLIVLGDAPEAEASREVSADAPGNESVQRADLEKVEVLLAQLQIKIEAMDHTVQDMPRSALPVDGAAMKEDLAGLESMIRELQESTMAAKSERGPEGAALKEDTDAIETLLRNTKAHLEEIKLPDPETAITQDNLDEVHAAVRVTNEALETLTEKLEATSASKGDVAAVETLAADIKTMTEGLKEKLEAMSEEAKPEVMTKADLDVLGVLCTEIKTSVNEIALPNPEDLPSKADIESLQGLIADFRESHDKMRDSYETDIAVTAKAFDDRKQEFEDTINQLGEVKTLIEGVKDELVEKMSDGELKLSIDTFGATLASLEEKSGHEDVISEVKEVMEKVKEEFERAHESLEAIKTDNAQSSETVLERHSEHKDAIIKELTEKLDGLFDGLMSKYDDAQKAAEAKSAMVEEKAQEQQELLNSTKVMTDDLKLSIDTLGTAMTTFMAELPSTMEKMAEESKTVFNQALETHSKLEETTETLKGEHLATRDEVAKVLAAVDIVQSDMSEHNPRFMVTLEEVRALINQHYEHSQQTSEAAAEQAQAVKDLQETLRAGFEDTKAQVEAHAEGVRSHHEDLKTSLPTLLPAAVEVAPSVEKYDDAAVHEKLDKLMGHVEEAGDRSIQVERLDQIHEKVMATAAEVSAFVAAQNKQIIADHESKEKEAEEIGLLLERRLERKDQLEADITVLNEEKETLQQAVESLKAEKEALAVQKSRLNADVSAMQTALLIRRDELHEMDNKALAIERRMLEGVMNQSRMLLLSKTAKPAPKKKPQGRDLRVPSNASAMSSHTVTSSVPDLKPLHAMAMKSRPGLNRNGPAPNTAERRIMSLNQIAHNVPTGAHAFVPAVEKASLLSGMQSGGMKRSHSVKTNFMQRKPSWSTKRNASMTVHNKENETLSEADEEDDLESPGAGVSEAGTVDRRESYLSGTDGSMTYGTGSYITDGETPELESRRSYAPSDMTYDTGSYLTGGSYMTGSEIDRRTSLGSISNSAAGIVAGGETSTIDEEEEEAEAELGAERVVAKEDDESPLEMPPQIGKSEWAPPSDSGLGTDCPTAMLSGGEDYFK